MWYTDSQRKGILFLPLFLQLDTEASLIPKGCVKSAILGWFWSLTTLAPPAPHTEKGSWKHQWHTLWEKQPKIILTSVCFFRSVFLGGGVDKRTNKEAMAYFIYFNFNFYYVECPLPPSILWSSLNRQELWGFAVSLSKVNPTHIQIRCARGGHSHT